VDLRRIAEWLSMPVQALQDLNPELRRWTTPVRATDYELKVPGGAGDIVRAHLAQTDPDELAPLNWHTVKKGETLVTIAKKLKVNRTDLAEANYLSIRAKVATGQRLIIPRAPALIAARTDNPAPDTEARQVDVALASRAVPEAGESAQTSRVHRVKRGDTLSSIARLYRTTVASLKTWNRLRSNSIQVGQRLTIFTDRPSTATN
jgi:membrane-bound lytic murein transglycosylase D